jgi:hypothetical protein
VELPLHEALAMVERGEIADGKTIMLLYPRRPQGLGGRPPAPAGALTIAPSPGRLDWDKVRAFLAVARSGGLGAAASALRVSEATVGRHLRALEEELGAPLFDRLPNRLALTRLGAGLVEAAGAMEEEALRFERAARAVLRHPASRCGSRPPRRWRCSWPATSTGCWRRCRPACSSGSRARARP